MYNRVLVLLKHSSNVYDDVLQKISNYVIKIGLCDIHYNYVYI